MRLRRSPSTRLDHGNLQLDDDLHRLPFPAQIPAVVLMRRLPVGRNQDGDRVWSWEAAGSVPAISYETRVVDGDHDNLTVRVVVLADEIRDIGELAFKITSDVGEEYVYRITDFEQNGYRLTLTGRRSQ